MSSNLSKAGVVARSGRVRCSEAWAMIITMGVDASVSMIMSMGVEASMSLVKSDKSEVASWEDDVVFRVAIVGDQDAAIISAGKLDLIEFDCLHWRVERLTIVLDHDCAGVNSCCCELTVDISANFDVAANLLEQNTMAAHHRVF